MTLVAAAVVVWSKRLNLPATECQKAGQGAPRAKTRLKWEREMHQPRASQTLALSRDLGTPDAPPRRRRWASPRCIVPPLAGLALLALAACRSGQPVGPGLTPPPTIAMEPGAQTPPPIASGASPPPAAETPAGLSLAPPVAATPTILFKVGDKVITPVAVKKVTVAAADIAGNPAERGKLVNCAGEPCPWRGKPDAPITLIELTDFGCQHCRQFIVDTLPEIEARFVDTGKARLVSHPLAGAGRPEILTTAAWCAYRQGKYFEFQRAAYGEDLMSPAGNVMDAISILARQLSLDPAQIQSCMVSEEMRGRIRAISDEAVAFGVAYTPALLVADTLIEGGMPLEVYVKRIERALERTQGSAAGP